MFRRIVREIINRIIGGLTRREVSEIIRQKYTGPDGSPISGAEVRRQIDRAERLIDVGRRMNDDPGLRIPAPRLPETPLLEPDAIDLTAYDVIVVYDDPETGESRRERITVYDTEGKSGEELADLAKDTLKRGQSDYRDGGGVNFEDEAEVEVIIITGGRRPRK